MKNKRMRLLGVLLIAACLLCACGRTEGEDSDSTYAFSRREEQEVDMYSLSFPVECFTSMTKEDLLSRGTKENEVYDEWLFNYLDTPLCIYGRRYSWDSESGRSMYFAYDKLTGNISDACRDPLCDHTSCLWGTVTGAHNIYRGADGLFFVDEQADYSQMEDGNGGIGGEDYQYYVTQIYATDFLGNDAKRLYKTEGIVSYLKQLGKHLWFYQTTWDAVNAVELEELIRLDLETGRPETIMCSDQEQTDWFYPLENALLYLKAAYDADGNYIGISSTYMRDLETGTDELFFEEEDGVCEYIMVGLHDNALYYRKYNIEENTSTLYRRGNGGFGEEEEMDAVYGRLTNWSNDGLYWFEPMKYGGVLYRDGAEPYTVKVGYSHQGYLLDGDLFLFCYNVRTTVAKHYWRLIDLKTGELLEFIVP